MGEGVSHAMNGARQPRAAAVPLCRSAHSVHRSATSMHEGAHMVHEHARQVASAARRPIGNDGRPTERAIGITKPASPLAGTGHRLTGPARQKAAAAGGLDAGWHGRRRAGRALAAAGGHVDAGAGDSAEAASEVGSLLLPPSRGECFGLLLELARG
jgi:hypothetical protein